MRGFIMLMVAACCCGGCAPGENPASKQAPTATPRGKDRASDPISTPHEPVAVAAAPAMTKDEIAALVKSILAEELAKRTQAQTAGTEADAGKRLEQEKAAAEAAQQAARDAVDKRAAEARLAERKEEEELARFLLLPDEVDRVERIKAKLKSESIWGLSSQDLDFAAAGFAAPLLHDALLEAAERYDPNIELDVLARKSKLTAEEKIELASMPPIARQQLLMFTAQFAGGKPSASADRYIREYVNRYPFIRKVLLEHLRDAKPAP